jgi:hypothetical protein
MTRLQKARDNLAQEWPPVNPKTKFGVVDEHCLLRVSPAVVSANDVKRIDLSLPVELVVWWVSESCLKSKSATGQI